MRIWRAHPRRVVEAAAALLALAAALIGLAAVAASPRSVFLFFDANSVALELVHRSIATGGPQNWTMSAALFFFPEIPVYEAVRLVSATPQQAIIANAIVYLVAVYVLLRVVAGLLWRGSRGTVSALVAFLALCLALVYESSSSRDSLELVSNLLFGGYYNGTTLAMFGSMALVVRVLQTTRRNWVPALGLGLLGALATASNPLYVLWVSMPLAIAVAIVMLTRRARLRELVPLAAAMLGPGLGMLARIPLDRYISAPTDRYIHPDGVSDAAEFYANQLRQLIGAGQLGELLVLLFLCACSISGLVLCVRGRLSTPASLVALFAVVSLPLAFAINIALGTQTVRYLQPMYFGQALAVVVFIGWAPSSARLRAAAARIAPSRRRAFGTLGVALAGVLAFGGVAAAINLAVTPRTPPMSIGCLESWINGRHLIGVGSFWNVRPAQVYGNDSVTLRQVDYELLVDPWLVNLASYSELDVSYVVYGGLDTREFRRTVVARLGEPAAIVDCGDFVILDYVGDPEMADVGERLSESARQRERERGFGD